MASGTGGLKARHLIGGWSVLFRWNSRGAFERKQEEYRQGGVVEHSILLCKAF
jgi:hypothetical protein